MSKFTKERIAEIDTMISKTIPQAMTKGCTLEEYHEHRVTLTLTVIQALFGADYIKPKKEGKPLIAKLKHKIADREDVNTITRMIDEFVGTVEVPYLNSISGNTNADDDMDIPATTTPVVSRLPKLDKINSKSLSEYLFGPSGVSKILISGLDVIELAAVAEKVKKINTRNNMILIGSAVLIGVGIGVGINMYRKSKNDDIDVDNIDVDDVEVDVDDVEVDVDDVPVVNLDE